MAGASQAERVGRAKDVMGLVASIVFVTGTMLGGGIWLVGLTMDAKIAPVQADVKTLKTDVGTLQANVGTLQANVETLQTDVKTLQTDVKTLKTDVKTLKTDVRTIQTDVRTIQTDVKTMQTDFRTLIDAIDLLASRMLTVDDLGRLKKETLAELKKELQGSRDPASNQDLQLPDASTSATNPIKLKCQPVPRIRMVRWIAPCDSDSPPTAAGQLVAGAGQGRMPVPFATTTNRGSSR